MKNNNLSYSPLTAITSLDGRYRSKIDELSPIVSEYGLINFRLQVEAKYLLALSGEGVTRKFNKTEKALLEKITSGENFDISTAEKVKALEEETRHDVKAMERTFREMLMGTTLEDQLEMIHLGLTSEDVNNISYRLQLQTATKEVILPTLDLIIDELIERAEKYKNTPMLARTHGQPAVPTTLGKEFAVFAARLNKQVRKLEAQKLTGKLNGAVGNFNALKYAFPEVDWIGFSEQFITSLGLFPNLTTTQIDPYDDVIELLQNYQRINGILIDFDQDTWRYISDNWFIQEARKGEVGSSTMPQKINPIDFENSEGNLGMSNSLCEHLSRKLAISRLQRDLSDSASIRNLGAILGYSLIGYKCILTGLSRIRPNSKKIEQELNKDWAILGEAVQTYLRKEKFEDPYSLISSLTRGEKVDPENWTSWIKDLPIIASQKEKLSDLTPEKYIGLAPEITELTIKEIKLSRKKGVINSSNKK